MIRNVYISENPRQNSSNPENDSKSPLDLMTDNIEINSVIIENHVN